MTKYLMPFVCLLLLGCASQKFGGTFNLASTAPVDSGQSVMMLFAGSDLEENVAFTLWFNGDKQAVLYPNSYIRVLSEPGLAKIRYIETFTGDPFRGKLPPSMAMNDRPKLSLVVGRTETFNMRAGEVHFVRFHMAFYEQYVACAESAETTSVCAKHRFKTMVEEVDSADALSLLAGSRESLK